MLLHNKIMRQYRIFHNRNKKVLAEKNKFRKNCARASVGGIENFYPYKH
jgi:hypothetical protein